VPKQAVRYDQIGPHVLVVNDKNVIERRNVKTGPVVNGSVVIEEGLKGNQRVIVEGGVCVAIARKTGMFL
jgi:multidrug efflux pump subunit AcrA (membrane-fusion protein)